MSTKPKPVHGGYPDSRPSGPWVRLGCDLCDRDDYDGITVEELALLKHTWEYIRDCVVGESVFDWANHCGICPECQADEEMS